jgi:hypothetical protein
MPQVLPSTLMGNIQSEPLDIITWNNSDFVFWFSSLHLSLLQSAREMRGAKGGEPVVYIRGLAPKISYKERCICENVHNENKLVYTVSTERNWSSDQYYKATAYVVHPSKQFCTST